MMADDTNQTEAPAEAPVEAASAPTEDQRGPRRERGARGGRGGGGDRGGRGRGRDDRNRGNRGGDDDGGEELIEKLVHINRVSKTVKGRSEERRVGKESRTWASTELETKK